MLAQNILETLAVLIEDTSVLANAQRRNLNILEQTGTSSVNTDGVNLLSG